MLRTGLVSVTFRKLLPEDIISLVKKAGLEAIEWGGDIHVPHRDVKRARQVREMTEDAGIKIASYGSYYRTGCKNEEVGSFERVLETAVALGAPLVRIWAGNRGSKDADDKWWDTVVNDAKRIADMTKEAQVLVAFEYHGGTLTDTPESAVKLLKEIGKSNVRCYWQILGENEVEYQLDALGKVSPWLANIHVFYWVSRDRRPLEEGREEWLRYIKAIASVPGDHFAMLEFVKNDDPNQFLKDAAVLKELVTAGSNDR